MAARLKRWWSRLSSTLAPGRSDRAAAREIQAHLALLEDEYQRRGLTPSDARTAARRALGSVAHTRDLHRDARAFVWLEDARRDARQAVRALRRSPGFAAVTILTLALGVGATSAIFSVVHAVLLTPLPYPNPDRLVRIVENVPAEESFRGVAVRMAAMYLGEFDTWRTRVRTLPQMAVTMPQAYTLQMPGGNRRLSGARVSPALFAMRGVPPVLGRGLIAEDERADAGVVVLSAAVWQRYFGGARDVIGRQIRLDDRPHTVVGVMPPAFGDDDVWAPFVVEPLRPGQVSVVAVTARLADGVSLEAAAAEVETVGRQLRDLPPASGGPPRFELTRVQDAEVARVRPALRVLTVAVGVVLLIVCANVANLLLTRASRRQHEIAVRQSLGAARGRIVRQLLTESVILGLGGGIAGLGLAHIGIRLLKALAVVELPAGFGQALDSVLLPRLDEIAISPAVLGFTFTIAVATGILFGLAPAVQLARSERAGVKTRAPGIAVTGRIGRTLATAQLVLATTLLVGSGLLLHSFVKLTSVDLGFDPRQTLSFDLVLPDHLLARDKLEVAETVAARLTALPGVQAAGFIDGPPLSNRTARPYGAFTPPLKTGDQRDGDDVVDQRLVSPGYLQAIGARLVSGRWLDDRDGRSRPAGILVTKAYADYYFGSHVDPVGAILETRTGPALIVGVVADVRFDGLDDEPRFIGFVDPRQPLEFNDAMLAQRGRQRSAEGNRLFMTGFTGALAYAVRVPGSDPVGLAADIRRIVSDVYPAAAVDSQMPMDRVVAGTVSQPRFYAVLVGVFAGIAGAIAAIGVYGVLACVVAQRTREIGIRMTLGARRSEILALVMRQGALLVAIGIPAGIGGALATSRYLQGMLFGLTPLDAVTYAVVTLGFAAVALFASYVPARRATRVNPVVALRYE